MVVNKKKEVFSDWKASLLHMFIQNQNQVSSELNIKIMTLLNWDFHCNIMQ